jgi:hypothetical protein
VLSFLTRESPADDVLARLWCMDLRAEVVIDAPAHAAWAVLGERFGQISDWAAPIETSSLRAINRWTVHLQTGGSCLVRTHATLELRGPLRLLHFLLKRRLQADGARVLEELRYQIEYGRPHPRKLTAA